MTWIEHPCFRQWCAVLSPSSSCYYGTRPTLPWLTPLFWSICRVIADNIEENPTVTQRINSLRRPRIIDPWLPYAARFN